MLRIVDNVRVRLHTTANTYIVNARLNLVPNYKITNVMKKINSSHIWQQYKACTACTTQCVFTSVAPQYTGHLIAKQKMKCNLPKFNYVNRSAKQKMNYSFNKRRSIHCVPMRNNAHT